MTKRTDIHSEKSLTPEDYAIVEYFYLGLPSLNLFGLSGQYLAIVKAAREKLEKIRQLVDAHGAKIHPSISQCDHCGAHYKHGALVKHLPTGEYLTIGWQCADNRFDLGNIEYERKRIKKVLKMIAARRSMFRKLLSFARDYPVELRGLNAYRTDNFLGSLRAQLMKKGKLSDRQIECIQPAIAKRAAWDAERAAKQAAEDALPKSPVVEGKKVELTGEVLSTKWRDGYYGPQLKMLVRDERGFKVWGSVPKTIAGEGEGELKGKTITFIAEVKKSDDDEHFGFFKRPRGAAIAEAA